MTCARRVYYVLILLFITIQCVKKVRKFDIKSIQGIRILVVFKHPVNTRIYVS